VAWALVLLLGSMVCRRLLGSTVCRRLWEWGLATQQVWAWGVVWEVGVAPCSSQGVLVAAS
jgi:hypothetical protein